MNHLAQAIAETHAYYVGQNDDLEGFFTDLAIMILDAGDAEDLAEDLLLNVLECKALDGEDEEEEE